MRRLSAAVVLVLLFTRPASAQAPPPRPPVPTAAEELNARANNDAAYLLAAYMAALANAGMPPSPSDIDEATRQYLTNGAAATGVPTQGPAAAYFHNGAAVTGVAASGPGADYFRNGSQVLAYYPAPRPVAPTATAQPAVAQLDAGTAAASEEGAGVPDAAEEAGTPAAPAPTETTPTPASTSSVPASPPVETPALQSEAMPPAPLVSSSCPPCGVAAMAEAPAAAPQCPPGPSQLARIATALGGALCGGLAVVLWRGPRSPRPRRLPGKERAHAK